MWRLYVAQLLITQDDDAYVSKMCKGI